MLFVKTLFWLLAGHALADYVFQSEWMVKHKDPTQERDDHYGPWWWTMLAHSLINGLMVYFALGDKWIGLAFVEVFVHFLTDTAKCNGNINTHVDQFIHVFCKVAYALIVVTSIG